MEGIDEVQAKRDEENITGDLDENGVEGYSVESWNLRCVRSWWSNMLRSQDEIETCDEHVFEEEVSLVEMDESMKASWLACISAAECWDGKEVARVETRETL